MPRRYSADFSRRFVISLWAHAPASLRHGGWVRWRKEHRAMTLTRARSNLAGSSGIRTRAVGTRLCSDAVIEDPSTPIGSNFFSWRCRRLDPGGHGLSRRADGSRRAEYRGALAARL